MIINPWIGIHHLHDEKRTVFASSNTEVAWSYWEVNEPNNVNAGEDCTHLYTLPEYDSTVELNDCNYKDLNDNGYCDDESNTKECAWDGGDCCGDGLYEKVKTENHLGDPTCSSCECLEPSRWNDDNCDEFRRFICEKEGTG